MKLSKHLVFFLFIMAMLLPGLFFWPFILANIIKPLALIIWLLLRIFVLSIDQKYYWGASIFILVLFLFRLLPQGQPPIQSEDAGEANAAIQTIEQWHLRFTPIGHGDYYQQSLKRELIYLLLSYYASKQHTSTNYILFNALESGELPLPKHIHTFLFPEEGKKSEQALNNFIQAIQSAPQKWLQRWTGQETAGYYRMIDEVLSYMEGLMEVKNDDGRFTPIKH